MLRKVSLGFSCLLSTACNHGHLDHPEVSLQHRVSMKNESLTKHSSKGFPCMKHKLKKRARVAKVHGVVLEHEHTFGGSAWLRETTKRFVDKLRRSVIILTADNQKVDKLLVRSSTMDTGEN